MPGSGPSITNVLFYLIFKVIIRDIDTSIIPMSQMKKIENKVKQLIEDHTAKKCYNLDQKKKKICLSLEFKPFITNV